MSRHSNDPVHALLEARAAGYTAARVAQGVPVLDRDLNLLGELAAQSVREVLCRYLGDGVVSDQRAFEVRETKDNKGVELGGPGWAVVAGMEVSIPATRPLDTFQVVNPDTELPVEPEASELWYWLEVWLEEVDDTKDPALANPEDVGMLTSTRWRPTWVTRKTNSSTAPSLEAGHRALALACVRRSGTDTRVEDLRPVGLTLGRTGAAPGRLTLADAKQVPQVRLDANQVALTLGKSDAGLTLRPSGVELEAGSFSVSTTSGTGRVELSPDGEDRLLIKAGGRGSELLRLDQEASLYVGGRGATGSLQVLKHTTGNPLFRVAPAAQVQGASRYLEIGTDLDRKEPLLTLDEDSTLRVGDGATGAALHLRDTTRKNCIVLHAGGTTPLEVKRSSDGEEPATPSASRSITTTRDPRAEKPGTSADSPTPGTPSTGLPAPGSSTATNTKIETTASDVSLLKLSDEAELTLGGKGAAGTLDLMGSEHGEARVQLHATGRGAPVEEGIGPWYLRVNDGDPDAALMTLDREARLWLGGGGRRGELHLRDDAGKDCVQIDTSGGVRLLVQKFEKDARGEAVAVPLLTAKASGELALGGRDAVGMLTLNEPFKGEPFVELEAPGNTDRLGSLRIRNTAGELAAEIASFQDGNYWGGRVQVITQTTNQTGETSKQTAMLGGSGLTLNSTAGGRMIWLDSATGQGRFNGAVMFPNAADCAERFPLAHEQTAPPGTVLVTSTDEALRACDQPYDTRVVGVVSGAGGLKPGIVLNDALVDGAAVALVGRVFCKVDASFGAIAPGDLLTTSSTPGHAMRAADRERAFGAVLGKALGALSEGQGLIPILVTLQ